MYGPMRGPPPGPPGGSMPPLSSMGPGGPGPGPGHRPSWPPSTMSPYGQGSPGYVGQGPPTGGPGTPIIPSPGHGPDSDQMYMMKNVPNSMAGDMPPATNNSGENGVNAETLDNMKHSPGTAPNTPRDGEPQMDFNLPNFSQQGNSNESEAILKIKESMQEEAKRFEKESDGNNGGGGGTGPAGAGGTGPGGQSDFFLP